MTIPRRLLGAIVLLVGLLSHGNALATDSLVRLELQPETVIDEGTTQMTLPILLSNNVGIAGFQCDIYLPVGFEVATTDSGDLAIALGRTTADHHQIATHIMSDGALRLVCTSAVNAVFTGNNGAVLSLTVAVGADVAVDNYTVALKNIVLTDPDAERYAPGDASGTIVVKTPDPVTITANNLTMTYGDDVPELTYTAEGADLVGVPTLSCEATATSPVGTYPIVVGKGTVENRNVILVNGTLTIVPAPLTITAGTYTKKQGEAMPEFTLAYDGFKNGETSEVLAVQPVVSCEANEASTPGEYPVTVTGAEAQNYSISYVDGKLIVTEADLVTITARSYTREYGDANPTFEYDVTGAALDGTPEIICEATPLSPVGTYPIVIRKGSVTNYNDAYVNGTLTIEPATLTASVDDYRREQGEDNPVFTILYSGWKNGEDERVLTEKPIAVCEATAESEPGDYPITVSGGEAQNYAFEYVNGTLTVTAPSGIAELQADGKERRIYTMSGHSIPQLQRGVNIIVTGDGRRVKMVRK